MKARGQTLVLFALFLTVLIGVSALAIDYANWLLTDRKLQNVSDHAALAGASVFNQNINQASCTTNPGQQLCIDARIHAWTSLSQELDLGLDPVTVVECLGNAGNTPQAGWTDASDAGCPAASFDGHHLWVSTPPPNNPSYTGPGQVNGSLAGNFGIVWVRVDRPTQTFLSGIFGINARDRIGWATAGVLPNDFALQLFCRDGTNPAGGNSVCTSKGVGIEGGGGITIIRGDVGSNQSLQVTQQGGQGVILQDGNVFLVEGRCGPSTWNCPPATTGGISDGINPKNAFYIPPQPVPHFQSPLDYATLTNCPTQAEWEDPTTGHVPCVPRRPDAQYTVASPDYDWTCSASNASNHCGEPVLGFDVNGNRTAKCTAWFDPNGAPVGERHLRVYADVGASAFGGSQYGPQNIYRNINDATQDPPGALNGDLTPTVLTDPPSNWVYSRVGDDGAAYRASIQSPNGIPDPGLMTVRYVLFRTIDNNGTRDTAAGGNAVTVTVQLQENVGGTWTNRGPADVQVATETTTAYQYQVNTNVIQSFNALALRVTVATTRSTGAQAVNNRGAGISWAELETTNLQPALPPLIPPGYYHSINIPDNGCALLDPTGWKNGLLPYQLAGVYRFGGGSNDAAISLGTNSLLIGDGVTLVFDRDFPNPTGGRGITLSNGAALVINAWAVGGFDTSQTLPQLPADALGAAWGIDPTTTAGVYPGASAYGESSLGDPTQRRRGVCTPDTGTTSALSFCIERSTYSPVTYPIVHRGISFYFTNTWPATVIRDRFQMSGSTGNEPGIAFRGVLYAPYDDVKITGGNGFNTIGQVLSWTAKFAGQATIFLDYPYARCEQTNSCLPYLLEPTVNQ